MPIDLIVISSEASDVAWMQSEQRSPLSVPVTEYWRFIYLLHVISFRRLSYNILSATNAQGFSLLSIYFCIY